MNDAQGESTVYLSLGANLGDRERRLEEANRRLAEAELDILASSSIYETEPVDYRDQPWFLNQVLRVSTKLAPQALLRQCLKIESEMGRQRLIAKGPRIIDIDILLYENLIIETQGESALIIPHPRLHLRRFVLEPLCELVPDGVHPGLGKSFRQLLEELTDNAQVQKYGHSCS